MQKVKLIHHLYLSAHNGANTVMNSLLNSKELFAKNGIEMTSLSPDSFFSSSIDSIPQVSSKAVWRTRLKKWLIIMTKYSCLACDLMLYLSELRPAKRIAQKYLDLKPDKNEIVFFHTLIPCYYYLKKRTRTQNVVVVCHTNGDNFKMDRLYYPMLNRSIVYKHMLRMEEYVLKHADRINFVASMARENFLQLHPEVDPKKVTYIYNGVKNEIRSIKTWKQNDVVEFCCVASISPRKGQHYIINALKMFKNQKMPRVHFTFVGDGVDKMLLEEDVRRSRLENYVTFAGVSNNVDDYLVNSDVYILPSEDEGLPMAIIEAMRASLPIISTPVGGIPEMVENGVSGLLIQPNAQSIYDILKNVNSYDWKNMGSNARKIFEEKFIIEKMVEGYSNLLIFEE